MDAPDLCCLDQRTISARARTFDGFEPPSLHIKHKHKRHNRQSTEVNGGTKMRTLMDVQCFCLSIGFHTTSGCAVFEGIGTSQITHLYEELRDLAEGGHSYCVPLHSSPLDVPSITQKSSGGFQRTLTVATPTFHVADSNSLLYSPFVERWGPRPEAPGSKNKATKSRYIHKQKEISCRHEACT